MKAWPFLLLFAVLAGCSHAPPASAITRVTLSRTQCDPNCRFFEMTLYRDGRLDYDDGLSLSLHGRVDAHTTRDIFRSLALVPAFGPRSSYLAYRGQEPATTIWTQYSGTHWQVAFPTVDRFAPAPPDIGRLNTWAYAASILAGGAIARARQPTIARLSRLDMLQRVVFNSNGCYGRCAAYRATFNRDGSATLSDAMFLPGIARGKARNVRATVPFDKVTSLLGASGFARLKPRYPLKWVDVYGVSYEFDYRDGFSYTVQAPDRTQWPPEVAVLAGAFSQLVRDTAWH